VCAAVQTKPTRPSNHLVLLKLGSRRSSRQFGGRRMLQSKIIWLADCGGVALSRATLHHSRRLKPVFISAAAWRRKVGCECRRCVPRNCALWTRVWRGWLVFSCAWSVNLQVECSLRRWAGGMHESTGESSLQVGFRHPEMMRNVSPNATSTVSFLVWVLLMLTTA